MTEVSTSSATGAIDTMQNLALLVTISVLGPIIGGLIGIIRRPTERLVYNLLAFAAGVMLTIAFMELLPHSLSLAPRSLAILGLLAGAGVMYTLDRLIPHVHPQVCPTEENGSLRRTALYLVLGLALHNLPEGLAIGLGREANHLSLKIALAIAIHNIPEGICTASPYYYSTNNKRWSFLFSAITAVPILIGFLAGYFLLSSLSDPLMGVLMAATAGLMIYIATDELIPSAYRTHSHARIFSLFLGMLLVLGLGFLG